MLQGIQIDVQQIMPAAVATGLFVSLATAQAPSGATTPDGQPDNTFVDVAGLVNIACMDAPQSFGSGIDANENKQLQEILSGQYRHVLLDANYPQIIANVHAGWRIVVDGIVYDLLGAEQDSQRMQTRLRLQQVQL